MLPVPYRKHLCFIILLFFFPLSLFSRDIENQDADSTNQQNTTLEQKDTSVTKTSTLTKSPVGALWRSFVFPGWGQIYVENYWKAPIFIAGLGASVYFIIWNNQKYKFYQQEYDDLLGSDPDNTYELERLKSQKEYYRDNRDKSYFFLGATYILAAIDAYVGAHLFDFNVDDNLSIRLMPYYSNQFGLNCSFNIK
jgi:hypothetical protein